MAFLGKMKQSVESLSDKTKKRLAMEGLLKQACISLEDYFSPKIVKPEERFSRDLFRNAQGIVLISEGKGGLVFAGKAGTGVVLCRLDKQDEWSGPLAIKTGGISWGFQGGIAKCDHIILLPTSQHVHTFMAKGSIQIQGNAQAAVGKIGRDASMGVGASEKAIVPVLLYSFKSEGLYGGVSLEGAIITVRHSCNDDYYGCKNTPIENIIKGTIKVPKPNADYNRIVSLLNEYCNTSHPLQFPRADAGSRQSDIKNGIFDNTDQKNTEIDQGEERRGQLSQNAGISGAEIHVAEIVPPLDSDSRLDNNQSRLDNTQPRLDNTQPRLDNTQPRLDNTQPCLDNTQPRLDNTQPPLDSDPRLYNNQSPLDTKVGPSAPLLQQQPIPFYHAPKNQRTHPPPP